MKLNIRAAIAATAIACLSAGAFAQSRSAYFTDGYLFRSQLNPSFANDRNYVSIPGIGNINTAVMGTIGVKQVLYNVDGRTTTLLNPAVSVNEVMDGLKNNNRLGTDIRLGILAVGFKGMGGYNTIAVNARADANVRIPKSLFSLVKEGISNQTYDISDFGARANAYVEIALGHSRVLPFDTRWRVGANLKFLVGAGSIDARLDKADLTLGTDAWHAVTNARINASLKGLSYKTKFSDTTHRNYVNGADYSTDDLGVGGFGAAIDLGATFRLNSDWCFSAALSDLGFINWSNNMEASTNGDRDVVTSDYLFNTDKEADNSFKNEWRRLRDGLSELYQLDDNGDLGSRTTMLGATMTLAAEYSLPVYRPVSFGFLSTTRFMGDFTWTEARLSANYNRGAFNLGVNGAYGTYGLGFGWIANLNVPGFNLYLGMDHTIGRLAKQGVPLSSNASLSFGINIPF